jgi:hypothetical protein
LKREKIADVPIAIVKEPAVAEKEAAKDLMLAKI